MMHLSQVCNAVNGQMLGADTMLNGVSINTRADCEERLFVALKGENFDAHDYLEQAKQAGASAVLLEREVSTDLPTVLVSSTHTALLDLCAWWRSQFVIPVIGVTGSVGKTTVKEMLGAIFAELGRGVVTEGNLNNEIGMPLTLMRLAAEDRYAVIEMGMNNVGEIARMTAAAKPTIALVNNAAAAHLENLGTIEAVAEAKGEIFAGLSMDGIAIINNDDVFAGRWRELVGSRRVISFGLQKPADISAQYQVTKRSLSIQVSALDESFNVELNSIGEHNVRNALAAIAVAVAANISSDKIISGLQNYSPVAGRLNISRVAGLTLIDDTYNANPLSMLAAMQVLVKYPEHCLIVGDMAELGDAAEYEHRHLGELAAELGIQKILACGDFAELVVDAFGDNGKAFSEQGQLIEHAQQNLSQGAVLVKGSRSAKMERVVHALTDANSNLATTSVLSADSGNGAH